MVAPVDGVRGDAVLLVVGLLDGAAAVAFVDEAADGFRHDVAEEHALAVHVPRGAARRLDEARFVAQEAFLVGVQDADERDFRQVETFAQQVDAHEDVHLARSQLAQDFHALDGVDVRVDVFDFEADVAQVVRQVFRRALGEGGDEHALVRGDAGVAELDGFVDLPFQRQEGDGGLQQSRRADELLDDEGLPEAARVEGFHGFGGGVGRGAQFRELVEEDAPEALRGFGDGLARLAAPRVRVAALGFEDGNVVAVAGRAVDVFEGAGRRAEVEELRLPRHEFVEAQGAVVQRGGQAEAVVDEDLFARAVALVHAADLWDGGVRFVDDGEMVRREVVLQGGGRGARRAHGEVAGVVLDAFAEADLADEFEVVVGAHLEPLGFDELAALFEPGDALGEFLADGGDGGVSLFGCGDVLLDGEEEVAGELLATASGGGVDEADGVDLVAEEFDADGFAVALRGVDFHDVAPHAEATALEVVVVAFEEELRQAGEQGVAVHFLSCVDGEGEVAVVFRRAEAVDAGDAGDDDDVPPQEQRAHGVEAEAVDFVVDRAVLFDVGVGAGDVGFRLVVVEVGDEVFDGVVREEALELGVELGGEGLVVAEDEDGAVLRGDDVGHGEGLAAAGDAEEALVLVAGAQGFEELADGLLLVAGRREVRLELEDAHGGCGRGRRVVAP